MLPKCYTLVSFENRMGRVALGFDQTDWTYSVE